MGLIAIKIKRSRQGKRGRKIAEKIGLNVHDKKDSHEICFVPDQDHAKVVEKALGKKFSGKITNEHGEFLGDHKGVHKYTIGQRRGLGVSSKDKLYVADIDAQSQKIVLADKSSLSVSQVMASDFKFLVPMELWPNKVSVKIRARSEAQYARAKLNETCPNKLHITFDENVFGVALGQAAVVYDGDIMLGGGLLSARLDGAFPRSIAGS